MDPFARFRSNHFAIQSERSLAFRAWCHKRNIAIQLEAPNSQRMAIYSQNHGIPWIVSHVSEEDSFHPQQNTEERFLEELASFLQHGEVAVLIETTYEPHYAQAGIDAYIGGCAYAVNHQGCYVRLGLHDIFPLACHLGQPNQHIEY